MRDWLYASKRTDDRDTESTPARLVLEIASDLPDKYGVRTLDAFQLASELVWCNEKPRNRPHICADERLGQAVSDAGFEVISLYSL